MAQQLLTRYQLVRMMKISAYSPGADGSNDEGGIKKLNRLLIRLFDSHKGKVCCQLLDARYLGACKEATVDALSQNIHCVLLQNKVSWDSCVALGLLGNAAVNEGGNKLHHDLRTTAK